MLSLNVYHMYHNLKTKYTKNQSTMKEDTSAISHTKKN